MRAIKILFCFVVYICINWMAYSKATFIIITIAVKKKMNKSVFKCNWQDDCAHFSYLKSAPSSPNNTQAPLVMCVDVHAKINRESWIRRILFLKQQIFEGFFVEAKKYSY